MEEITQKIILDFLNIARGSLFEMQTQLIIGTNLNFLQEKDLEEIKLRGYQQKSRKC